MDDSYPGDLERFLVKKAPPSVLYIPDFLSQEQEATLLTEIYQTPRPKWEQLSHRRLQNWGGIVAKNGLIPDKLPVWLSDQIDRIYKLGVFPQGCKPNHVLLNEYLSGQGIMPHSDGPVYHPIVSTISLGSHTFLDFYQQPISELEAVPKLPVDLSEISKKSNWLSGDSVEEKAEPKCQLKSDNNESLGAAEHGDQENRSTCQRRYAGSLLLQARSLVFIKEQMYTDYLHGIAERHIDRISDRRADSFANGGGELETTAGVSKEDPREVVLNNDIWNVDGSGEFGVGGGFLPRETRVSLTIRNVPKVARISVNSLLRK